MKLSLLLVALTNVFSCATTIAVVRMLWHQIYRDAIGPDDNQRASTMPYLPFLMAAHRQLQPSEQQEASTTIDCFSTCCISNNNAPAGFSWGPTTCTLLRAEVSYENGQKEQLVACELPNNQIVEVTWLPETLTAVFESGASLLVASDIIIDAENELQIPAGSTYEVTSTDLFPATGGSSRRLPVTTGKKKVLLIIEERTAFDERSIADEIFGGGSDVINLASQYAACSYNQLTFSKYSAKGRVNGGVLTVSIPNSTISGVEQGVIRGAMLSQAAADLGEFLPPANVDYVILCMPFGTVGGNSGDRWIGYGYINHYLSVLNDKWCASPSLLLHEVGHNLGMAHAGGEPTGQYDDQSGMMGYSYSGDEGPEMCFNGPNTYHLGWFPQYHLDLTVGSAGTIYWTGYLIGFAEKHPNDADRGDDKMIIKITGGPSDDDYYVHFDRKIGFNAGSQEGVDKVLVARRGNGIDYASRQSWLEAQLDVEDMHSAANFAGLTITVNAIDNGSPRRAKVSIKLGPDLPITGWPTVSLTPSSVPSLGPSSEPTWLPSVGPTSLPSSEPTLIPSVGPTSSPSSEPTSSPSFESTSTPSHEPTASPSVKPTPGPTRSPTPLPTPNPTPEPTPLPTPLPTPEPTPRPTPHPSPVPTTPRPTDIPTSKPTPQPTVASAPTLRPTYQNEADLQIACTYIGQPSISLCRNQKVVSRSASTVGQIPTQIGLLTNLVTIDLWDPVSTIPTQIGNLVELVDLRFTGTNLRGTLPTELGRLRKLTSIQMEKNALTGGIPTEFGDLLHLQNLKIVASPLRGTFPSELGKLGQLTSLNLLWTRLTGTIPTTISGMKQLTYWFQGGVRGFSATSTEPALRGTIPTEIFSLSKLTYLSLYANQLTGTIPSDIGRLSNVLKWIEFDQNSLSGQLPTELGQLTVLTHLLLHSNNLSGTFPESLCNGQILPNNGPSIDCERIECSCCTKYFSEFPKC